MSEPDLGPTAFPLNGVQIDCDGVAMVRIDQSAGRGWKARRGACPPTPEGTAPVALLGIQCLSQQRDPDRRGAGPCFADVAQGRPIRITLIGAGDGANHDIVRPGGTP